MRGTSLTTIATITMLALGGGARAAEPTPGELTYLGPTTGVHGANLAATASLMLPGNVPVEGREVAFALLNDDGTEASSAAGTTNAEGVAAASVALTVPAGHSYVLEVIFAGDGEVAAAETSMSIDVGVASSKMTYTGTTGAVRGSTINLKARLQHATTNANLAGRAISFRIPGLLDMSAPTNAAGEASVSFKLDATYGSYPLTVGWAGDANITGSEKAQSIAINWSWTFTAEQGLGTIRLNDILDEYRVTSGTLDSGIVTGASISVPVPNLAAAVIVVATKASTENSLEFIGDARFGSFQATGAVGAQPFALVGTSLAS